MATLRNTEMQTIAYSMTSRMKTAKEALNLDGTFYRLGKRNIRGIMCDTFESVKYDETFMDKNYYKLVVTVYFTEDFMKVGINGETESRIPVYYIITGWSNPNDITLKLQYNIFEFYDVVWPEMYSSFRIDRCYPKEASKAYFVLILDVPTQIAAKMEEQDEIVIQELRSEIIKHAKVPAIRIPYLKAVYKPGLVSVTGVMLERPPEFLQFYLFDSGDMKTLDKDLKVIGEADNEEKCSYACVEEGDFPCKGFYFCGQTCFLKSIDPMEKQDPDTDERVLGDCKEYLRAVIDSSNFRQSYLRDALGNLETAVLNASIPVAFRIPNGEGIVVVKDIIVGDGPFTGVDAGDKPFTVSIAWRKLDIEVETTRTMDYVGSLHDCYKRCKHAGSECSSFSFCPDSTKDNKECMITTELVIKGVTKDTDLIDDKNCNVYNLKFLDYFIPFTGRLSLLEGDSVFRSVSSLEKCAQNCKREDNFKCRGFEYCRSKKICTLHSKHILDLKPDQTKVSDGKECVHYAARYIEDYMNMGLTLIKDSSDVRYGTSLEDCAKICSEDLKQNCKSFNYCGTNSEDFSDSRCEFSSKLLRDDNVTVTEVESCVHYEKRDIVHDWDKDWDKDSNKGKDCETCNITTEIVIKEKRLLPQGYSNKGFAGLVTGMLFLGTAIGAGGFIYYSYRRSQTSTGGMAVRFMKNDS